jgi:Protein of unknown function (DUF3224)
MTKKLETRLEIAAWDEKPYREFDDGRKFTRANVTLKGSADGLDAEATWEALMYYAADGTGTYVGLMHLTGKLDGREGSFVMEGRGTYDGKQARVESTVVAGSGTGGLAGISGTSESVSTHEDYPFWPMTITYDVK